MTADVLSLVPTQTTTQVPEPAPLKRCAIIGTAPSWKECPYDDLGLEKWTLNDGYLVGVPFVPGSICRHYDLHPVHQMWFRNPQQPLDPRTVPMGVYVRPAGHLDWLRQRQHPVFLLERRPEAPNATPFPWQGVLDHFADIWPLRKTRAGQIVKGPDYEVSTPTWMLMHAIMEGYREIHVYGIHLATEWEYVQQRPNFEFLLGYARGKGITIVLPQCTPICRAGYRYAQEPKADLAVQTAALAVSAIKTQGAALKQKLATLPATAIAERQDLAYQVRHLDVCLVDARQTQQRAQMALNAKGAIV